MAAIATSMQQLSNHTVLASANNQLLKRDLVLRGDKNKDETLKKKLRCTPLYAKELFPNKEQITNDHEMSICQNAVATGAVAAFKIPLKRKAPSAAMGAPPVKKQQQRIDYRNYKYKPMNTMRGRGRGRGLNTSDNKQASVAKPAQKKQF